MRRSIYPNGSGGGADFDVIVADQAFTSLTQLEAAHPAADNQFKGAIVLSGGGPGRLFFSTGSAWVPTVDVVWTTSATGAGVYDGIIGDAGAAAVDGDLAVDGNGTVYVLVVDAGGRIGVIPRSLTGGIIVGETHTAALVAHWYKEDPSTATDVTEFASGGASITYNSGTGATTLQAGASDGAAIVLGSTPIGAGVVYMALLGATWAGNRSGAEGLAEFRYGASAPYDRIQVLAEVSGTYAFGAGAGGGASITGADPSTEHDVAFLWDGTNARAYYNNPDAAQDSAVPAPDGSGAGTPATTTSAFGAQIIANADASTPSLVCDGAYIITLTAI